MLTASHNPKEYNGYKAYWNDGAQVLAPHDTNIIREVNAIKSVDDIKFKGNPALIEIIGKEIDDIYLNKINTISLSPDSIKRNSDMKIVYTPIHGTTVRLVPAALKAYGFTNIINVPEQDVVSGDFPTVYSPNPEEPAALKMAVEKGEEVDADLVMASDPDGDRLGIAVKDNTGKFVLVNGNQTALLFTYYIIRRWKELGKLNGKQYVVKTIVTTELIVDIAKKFKLHYFDCYTGFKWIAAIIRENEGKLQYIGGGEESYGYLAQDFVRDKDAVSACTLMAEIAAWAKDNGKSLFELIQDIYLEFGFSKEKGISIVKKGKSGAEEIKKIMSNLRSKPPKEIAGSQVIVIKDYDTLRLIDVSAGTTNAMEMPETSNVLQFFTADGTKISVRPSGTEPKIKFYIEVRGELKNRKDYEKANQVADEKIKAVMASLKLD